MDKQPLISIVVPVYNSGKILSQLIDALDKSIKKEVDWELILVDDHSTDDTWNQLKQMASGHISIIRLGRNSGQQNATLAGLSKAKGQWVVTMDDDLQHDPAMIHLMLEKAIAENALLVYARFGERSFSSFRNFIRRMGFFFVWLSGERYTVGSSFRLIRGDVCKKVSVHTGHEVFLDEMLLWHTDAIAYVDAVHGKSVLGHSRYKARGLVTWSMDFMFFSSNVHLRFIAKLGLLIAIFSFLIGAYFLVKKLWLGTPVPGYTSLIVSVLFSTGLIMLAIGSLARYLSSMYLAQHGKPPFFIEEEK